LRRPGVAAASSCSLKRSGMMLMRKGQFCGSESDWRGGRPARSCGGMRGLGRWRAGRACARAGQECYGAPGGRRGDSCRGR
jgi:hypothetical protein